MSRVRVESLSGATTNESLRAAFSGFGTIIDSSLASTVGYVTFSSPEAATAAITNMNDEVVDGNRVQVIRAPEQLGGEDSIQEVPYGGSVV